MPQEIPITGRGARRRSGGSLSRGVWLSLLALPVALACWLLLESIGFLSTLVTYLYAVAAVWLFRRGCGGLISARGARVISAVVVAGVLVCIAAGAVWASATAYSAAPWTDVTSPLAASVSPAFWSWFGQTHIATGEVFRANAVTLLLGLLFAAAGILPVLLRTTGRRPLGPRSSIAVSASLLVAAVAVVVVANQVPGGWSAPSTAADPLVVHVGDCMLDASSTTLTIVPCDQPHGAEAFAQVLLPGYPSPGYPDTTWFAAAAPPACTAAFAGFIGHPLEGSTLQLSEQLPGEQAWTAGDHTALCVASDPVAPIEASLAGAQR